MEPTICRIAVAQDVLVPPEAEVIFPGKIVDSVVNIETGMVSAVSKFVNKTGLLMTHGLVQPENRVISLRLMNLTNKSCKIKKDTITAKMKNVEIKEIQVPEQDIDHDAFSKDPKDIGTTNVVEHTIDTGDARPMHIPTHRLPFSKLKMTEEEILEMAKRDIIEPGYGPWSFPVVLITQPKLRFMIDNRSLNKLRHPMGMLPMSPGGQRSVCVRQKDSGEETSVRAALWCESPLDPPIPPSYVTARTGWESNISHPSKIHAPHPIPCRVAATVVREPSPTPEEAEEPANSVSGETTLNPSLASDVEDGDVLDKLSIRVGPQDTLDIPSIPLLPIRVEEPTPQSAAATPRLTQDSTEAASATEPARRVVWYHLASQRVTDVKLATWSNVQAGRVVLDIGVTKTSKATLRMEPSSLLAETVQEGSAMRPFLKDEYGSPMYFLDRDPAHFRHILNYLRLENQWSSQSLPHVVRYLYDLRAETDHFQLQGLYDHINRRITTLVESEYDVNL
ncbi:unnamed protein product [Mytilus coruscus]|uniref:Potassium channel tetramerisation-type BTB domain-containing protein n=1 Tax=Mytilus coruscus TaxID=42192 RepID=A0A6J8EUG0_MYTCO|nr:unnamed protein product [Mytilus coruscus]